MKTKKFTAFLIAAGVMAACTLTGFTTYSVSMNLFGLQDMVLGVSGNSVGGNSNNSEDVQLISVAGVAGSPEFMAQKEWQDFLDNYDRDGRLLAAVGNGPTGLDKKYDMYLVYTKQMAGKLDEITAKYNLTLHSEMDMFETNADLASKLGGNLIKGSYKALGGYIYEDKTFQFDGDAKLANGKKFSIQFRNEAKGSFSEVALNIQDADKYESWEYKTADGTSVLLVLGPEKGLVLADTEKSFVLINALTGTGENGAGHPFDGEDFITKADLEAFADGFDFTVL
ncbi:MAG: hypothetical protein FWF08_01585 [Oscillospiraceae bacterium]|nr:hypothetical protein [Oscillospiraceae bacterium]